jgi:hypothetical protein
MKKEKGKSLLKLLCASKGITIQQVVYHSNVSRMTLHNWGSYDDDDHEKSNNDIVKLVAAIDISIDRMGGVQVFNVDMPRGASQLTLMINKA